jgi:hypothetical protein
MQSGMDGGAAAAGAAGPALPEAAKPLGPPLPEGQLHGAALIEGLMNWTTQVGLELHGHQQAVAFWEVLYVTSSTNKHVAAETFSRFGPWRYLAIKY